jgi:hypothetical protein
VIHGIDVALFDQYRFLIGADQNSMVSLPVSDALTDALEVRLFGSRSTVSCRATRTAL